MSQTLKDIYNDERNKNIGACDSGHDYNDYYIGLIYPSDYMYASSSCYDKENNTSTKLGYSTTESSDYRACTNDNWLYTGSDYWTLSNSKHADALDKYTDSYSSWNVKFTSIIALPDEATTYVFPTYITSKGYVYYQNYLKNYEIRPSLYLSSEVTNNGGNGTIDSPYIISIE